MLRRTGLFAGFDPSQLDELSERVTTVTCGGGEQIVEEGELGDAFFVIGQGAVRISTVDANGDDVVLARLEAGEYFGEQALFDEIPSRRNASATALVDTELLRVDQADFHRVLRSGGKVEQALREHRAQQLVQRWARQHPELGSLDAKVLDLLARNVRDHAPGEIIFSQGDVADGVHFITEGEVRIVITGGDGAEPGETVLVAGQMFGEVGSLQSARRVGSAVALTQARTLFLDSKQFRKLNESRPEVAAWVKDVQRIYEVPNRGLVSIHDGEHLGVRCVTSAFQLRDGRSVTASKVRGSEIFVLAEDGAPEGRQLVWENGPLRRELRIVDGRLVGILCNGYWAELGQACAMALEGTAIEAWREALFRDAGRLELAEPDWSSQPTALLCNCMRVTRERVSKAIAEGCTQVDAVSAATAAGTVCGGCRPSISSMLGNTTWEPVRIVAAIERAPDVRSYRLSPYSDSVVPYEVGQHLVIQSLIDDRFVARTYTLTSHPSEDCYEVTIKREPHGYFSGWLFERAGPDPFMRVAAPSGSGIHTLLGDGPIVCLVAGIGATPALALARHLDVTSAGQALHVDYSGHTLDGLALAEELRAIEQRRSNVSLELRATSQAGRLGPEEISRLAATHPEARYFICGPRAYDAAVTAALRSAGVPPERVHGEEFHHAGTAPST